MQGKCVSEVKGSAHPVQFSAGAHSEITALLFKNG